MAGIFPKPARALGLIVGITCLSGLHLVSASTARGFEPVVEYDWGLVRCLSEFPLRDEDRLHVDLLDLRRQLQNSLSLRLKEEPIEIRLYSTRRRYLDEVASLTPDVRRQRGVYVIRSGRASVFSFQQRGLDQTLRHEATHAWLHSALPYVPLWLDEGLASYFEAEPALRAEHPYLDRLQWSLQFGWRPDLEKLERIRTSDHLEIGDYRHAWGWVHFLLHESDASRTVLVDYFSRIADGEPPQPLSEFLAERIPRAGERCARHLEGWGK
jgi:hypothetical protein